MRRIANEPLVHFLLIGTALFCAYAMLGGDGEPRESEIRISAGRIEHLATVFERTWQRPPSRQELAGLVDDDVREEVAYREGMAIGLDTDDVIIRRRIRQKLEFVAEDLAMSIEATDDELAAYLAANADAFRADPQLDLRQVFCGSETPDAADLARLLDTLNREPQADAEQFGAATMLDHAHPAVSRSELANIFGGRFAAAAVGLEPGVWHGPIRSGYGTHLVIVDARRGGGVPELADVREAVLGEWQNARREEIIDEFYTSLLEQYDVTIDWSPREPQPGDDEGGS